MDNRLNTKFSLSSLSSGDNFDSEVSEAPDIRLWFPSYESPESDVSDDFDGFDVQKEITSKKYRSEEIYKSNQEKRFSKEVKEPTLDKINKELPKVEVTEKEDTQARSSIQPFSGCSSIPPKEKEGLSILEKVLVEIANRERSAKDHENSEKLSPSKGNVKEKTVIEEHNGSDNSFSSQKENVSLEKLIARRDCEEKSNGFISVKKKENAKARSENLSNRRTTDPLAEDPSARINKICTSVSYGNSRDGQVNNGSGCDLDGEKGEGRCGGEHNQATETAWLGRTELVDPGLPVIGGKWQCPRKNKPYQGPPLKQLRLERWVHRLHNK